MRSPLDQVRAALEAFWADEARERARWWRGSADAAGAGELVDRHDWIVSRAAQDAFDEAAAMGLVTGDERAALEAHLAHVRVEAALAPHRDGLRSDLRAELDLPDGPVPLLEAVAQWPTAADPRRQVLGRALAEVSRRVASRMLDARALAADRLGHVDHPDAGPELDALAAHAEALLVATDGAASEAVGWLLRGDLPEGPGALGRLVHALRAPRWDGAFPSRDRWRRVARDIGGLGLDRELSERVRAEPDHGGARPHARLAVRDAPRDVRLAAAPAEHGVLSELAAAEGVGRALAACMVAPALPVELRRPVVGTVGRAMGTLLAQIPAERGALQRMRGLDRSTADGVARHVGAAVLLETRLHAAAVVLQHGAGGSAAAHREQAPDLVRRALGVEVAPPMAILLGGSPPAVAARYRGRVCGLAGWVAMRDRYDEDWYRNPRADEPLRAGAQRGGLLAAERWVAEDLGAEADGEHARLRELFRG